MSSENLPDNHLVEQAVLLGDLGRDVGQVEVDVEGCQVFYQATIRAVPENQKCKNFTFMFVIIYLKYNMASIESSRS